MASAIPEKLAMIARTDMDDPVKEHPEREHCPLLNHVPSPVTVAPAAKWPPARLLPGI
jgi:hypothetical protein